MNSITVTGVDRVTAGLTDCGRTLTDPTTAHDRAARIIADAAQPPIRTGRLAQSIRPLGPPGARVGSDTPYARPVEARTGFLRRAIDQTRPQWLAAYSDAAVAACEEV